MKLENIPIEERYRRAIAGDALIVAALTRAVYEKYGDEGIKTLQKGMERTGRELAKALAKHFDIRVGNGDVTDYAKFVDFFHQVSLMDTKTVELSPKRWVVHATSCPAAAQYKRIFPDFCPWVLVALDRGMSSVVNKKIKAWMTEKCLARGDDYCEYIFELED
ncbi:MAG: L-2-amino-thiazoline-4-carboxylic acid hydrolase [Chloroflexota bacterium]|nr:L-2-amino-thiazoline-4-carboxylic acid hydrolase [Chloroflexota bacterium]